MAPDPFCPAVFCPLLHEARAAALLGFSLFPRRHRP